LKSIEIFPFSPNSVSGSSATVKVSEQVGAAKISITKVPRFPGAGSQTRFPGTGSQPRFQSKVRRNRFPSKVAKQGPEEQVKIIKHTIPERPPTRQEISGNYILEHG